MTIVRLERLTLYQRRSVQPLTDPSEFNFFQFSTRFNLACIAQLRLRLAKGKDRGRRFIARVKPDLVMHPERQKKHAYNLHYYLSTQGNAPLKQNDMVLTLEVLTTLPPNEPVALELTKILLARSDNAPLILRWYRYYRAFLPNTGLVGQLMLKRLMELSPALFQSKTHN
jgi:hypothetical protein